MAFLDKAGLERFWAHVVSLVGTKVEKEEGKGLSTEDFTTEEKEKLANITDYVDEAIANIDTNVTVAKITDLTATATELNYMDGVTSNVQTQLDAKVPINRTINGKALSSNITLSASDVSAYSKTEIDGKLSSKADSSHNHSASDINSGTLSSDRLPTVPITKGGTGATNSATALANLGAMPKSGGTFTGNAIAYSTNRTTSSLRNIEIRKSSATGTLQSTNKIIMVRA